MQNAFFVHGDFGSAKRNYKTKTLLIMKMAILLTVAASLHAGAKGYSQHITLSLKNVPIEKVFSEIQQQSGYSFIYTSEVLKDAAPISIEVKNASVNDVLDLCFKDQPVTYNISGKFVIVKRKEPPGQVSVPALIDIKGKVVNENSESLVGITVQVKGTGQITLTDDKGEFILHDIDPAGILVFSGAEMETKEIKINGNNFITVTLKQKIDALDETIIRGYYTTSKRLNTGSVSTVKADDISTQPVSNPLAALEGRVPGLLITQGNGIPGSNFTVRIRGQNSIQSGNSPLYIIDGVPFLNDADVLTQQSGINANSPFNTINPADIESIEILKDADATAIYGSRGANGVILITTKKGKAGKTSLDLNEYSGWGKVTRTMRYMNTQQYLQMRHEALMNDGVTPDPSNAYDFLVWDSTRYTDLKKLLIGGTAHTDNINLRLSGGNSNTIFSLGGNYYRETTVFPGNTADQRVALSLSLTHALPDNKFTTTVTINYSGDRSNLIPQDLTQFINLPPTIPDLYDSLGKLNWNGGGFSFNNALSYTLQSYNVTTDRLTANTTFNYAITPKLFLKANLGYNDINADETVLYPITSQDPSFSPTGSSFFGNNRVKNWILEPQCGYNSSVGKKGKLQVLLGMTWQEYSDKEYSINASGYTNDNLLNSTIGAQTLLSANGYSLYRYESVFGRINYAWDEKYIINLTARRDGSSRFGPGKQYADFGAAGFSWIFTKEKFIEKIFPFISFGKIRGSYGITGNDLIGNYRYLDAYSATQYPYQGQPSLFPNRLYNPNYSWEQINKTDLAVDLALFKDRIFITADGFNDKSVNQIINYSLPGQTGFATVLKNFPGVVQNRGIELSLTSEIVKARKFGWKTSFNFTSARNKLLAFPGLESSSYANTYIIGKSLNSFIGAAYAGVDPQTGVYQFLDKNKNLTFSPSTQDYIYLGKSDPEFYGNIQNTLTYLNWQLGFLLEFRKQTGRDAIFSSFDLVGSAVNEPTAVLDRWQMPGDISKFEKFTETFGPAGIAVFNLYNSGAALTNTSFCRLKNVSLSYNLSSTVLRKLKIEKCRFFVEGQNLFVITGYEGPDPETQTLQALPPLRTVVAGIQLTF